MAIYQGSNAPIFLELDKEILGIQDLNATLVKDNTILKAWALIDVSTTETTITLPLLQSETIKFTPGIAELFVKYWLGENTYFVEKLTVYIAEFKDEKIFGDDPQGTQEVIPIFARVTTNTIYSGGGGTSNHAALFNLDYLNSGHTGFATEAQGNKADQLEKDIILKASKEEVEVVRQTANAALPSANISSWALANTKPAYTAEEVNALPANTPLFNGEYDSLNGKPDLTDMFVNVTYAGDTGIMTFTKNDGTTIVVDLPLELLIKSGSYNPATKAIELVLANGEKISIDAAALVKEYIADETTLTLQDNVFSLKQSIIDSINAKLSKSQADGYYEAKFTKNTAFNKNFGSSAGTVVEGDRVLTDVPTGAVFTDTIRDISINGTVVDPTGNIVELPTQLLEITLSDGSTQSWRLVGVDNG